MSSVIRQMTGIFLLCLLSGCTITHALVIRNKTGKDLNIQAVTTQAYLSLEYLPAADSLVPFKQIRKRFFHQQVEQIPINMIDSLHYDFSLKDQWTVQLFPSLRPLRMKAIILQSAAGIDTISFMEKSVLDICEIEGKSSMKYMMFDIKVKE